MYMVEKLDAGDMLTKVEVPILEEDNVGTLHDKLSAAGAKLLAETLPPLLQGKLTPVPQDDSKATFAPNIKREQEKINWAKPGEEIYNHIRGLNPWPVAFTMINGQVLKVWQSQKVQVSEPAAPGTIMKIAADGIIVSSGDDTAIKITELQPSGKTKMPTEQFLRGSGSKIAIGSILGE